MGNRNLNDAVAPAATVLCRYRRCTPQYPDVSRTEETRLRELEELRYMLSEPRCRFYTNEEEHRLEELKDTNPGWRHELQFPFVRWCEAESD